MRRARLACLLWLAVPVCGAAETIFSARFAEPTARYDHAILGDPLEWGALEVTFAEGHRRLFRLPEARVFEDTAPRLVDLDGDGAPEVLVVETHIPRGAALAIYGPQGKIAATPHIGRTHRWLAPVGAADLDGDGHIEIAYVDRPHLARILKIWRYRNGRLEFVVQRAGVTNHRIGDPTIFGGIRHCGGVPELILTNPAWQRLVAARLDRGRIQIRDIGPNTPARGATGALACR